MRTLVPVVASALAFGALAGAAVAQDVPPPPPADTGTPAPVTPAPAPDPAAKPTPKPPPKPDPEPAFRPPAPTKSVSWTATLHRRVLVRAAPKPGASVRMRLSPIAPFAGGLVELLVTNSVVRDGEVWVQVLLPRRPNGITGWLHADDVSLKKNRVRVEIDVSDRRLFVFRDGRRVLQTSVALGKAGTPTPLGRFAVAEMLRTNIPGNFLGPIVLPLTAYSEKLNEFAGGDGRVAIHGTTSPGLIGTYASNGCIRMYNAMIVRLAKLAPPGTPVTIRR